MSKSKCGIYVVGNSGSPGAWTSKRGARRMVEQGLAVEEGPKVIRTIESHPKFEAAPNVRPLPPKLAVRDRAFEMPGDYRNEVLGLPNFVGVQAGRRRAAGRKAA